MDILEMLQNDYEDLCEEDLEMIEEELSAGTYPADYRLQCRLHIAQITNRFAEKRAQTGYTGERRIAYGMMKTEAEVTVKSGESESVAAQEEKVMTRAEILREKLLSIRSMPEPEKNFRTFLHTEEYMTNAFIDSNFSEFSHDEIIILLRDRAFDEAFLDKYFDVLDHTELALHQLYSEEFFMKHYKDMPVRTVLTRSKNPWRARANRSSKLTTFLRLKGVKI